MDVTNKSVVLRSLNQRDTRDRVPKDGAVEVIFEWPKWQSEELVCRGQHEES